MSGLLAQIELEYPARLFWLLVLPVIGYFAWRTGVTASAVKTRRWASVICRIITVVLLVLAFAGLILRGTSDQRFVIFLTDASRSVGGPSRQAAENFILKAQEGQGNHKAAYISFADKATTPDSERMVQTENLDNLQSNPAAALRLAAASIPVDEVPQIPVAYVPQIVLLTDGNETQGDLAKAALATRIPVTVFPLEAFPGPEVCITEVIAPTRGSRFSETPIEVVVVSNHEVKGAVRLFLNGQPVDDGRHEVLSIGENRIRFQLPPGGKQEVVIEARVDAPSDTIAENNKRRAIVFPARPTRILLVDAERTLAGPLAAALEQGFEVTLVTPDEFNADTPLDAYDLVVLSDVVPNELPAGTTAALDGYVDELGGGLIVLGGEQTFGKPSYAGTPLEGMMPVKVKEVEAEKVVLAMVLVIDTSGSMDEEQRMDLAKQAAKQSIGLLEPHDKAGVMAFSDHATWVAELAPCSDKSELMRRIDTLKPEGQTNMYGAVERAFLALEQTDAHRRHMILLTDGTPAPGDYCEIAKEMADAGITLSTVSISPGAEQDLLKKMARIAGDERRHRHCDDPADVPKILVQETQAATSEEGLHDFRPFVLRSLPGLDVESAPELAGHVPTDVKDGAEPLLMAGPDPLLTWWRYGDGVTVAFTSDAKNRWGRRWQSWPGYGAFWKRLVRHAARAPKPPSVSMQIRHNHSRAVVTLDVRNEEQAFMDAQGVSVAIGGPDGQSTTLDATQVAPGLYETSFTTDQLGQYTIEAVIQDGSGQEHRERNALFVDYPEELFFKPTNHKLLKSVAAATGGAYDPENPESVFTPDGRTVERITPLWYWLVIAAMLLFVVDVGLRRLRF